MIVGVGIDLCDVARMRRELDRSGDFAASVFTPVELDILRRHRSPDRFGAALFSAKEAVVKALRGDGPAGMLWRDIEIDPAGRAILRGRARRIAGARSIDHIHLDITHSETRAMACAFATSSGRHGQTGA